MLTATDASGTITLSYDNADRLTRVTYPNGMFFQIGYDAFGRRIQTVDQTGFTTNYTYDAAGRLATVTDGSHALIAAYTYDAVGRLAEKDLGNGTYTTYTYYANGAIHSLVNFGPRPATLDGAVNSRFDYTYDKDGACFRGDDPRRDDDLWLRRCRPAHLRQPAQRPGHHVRIRCRRQSHRRERQWRRHDLRRQQSGPVHVCRGRDL